MRKVSVHEVVYRIKRGFNNAWCLAVCWLSRGRWESEKRDGFLHLVESQAWVRERNRRRRSKWVSALREWDE